MVDPVDAGLDEAEEIDEDERDCLAEGIEVGYFFAGDMELEDHDGDDDGDNAVGKCFEPGGGEAVWFLADERMVGHVLVSSISITRGSIAQWNAACWARAAQKGW